MKLPLSTFTGSIQTLDALNKLPMSFKQKYRISRISNAVISLRKQFETTVNNYIRQNGAHVLKTYQPDCLDPDGNPCQSVNPVLETILTDPKDFNQPNVSIRIQPEGWEAFIAYQDMLLAEEVEIQFDAIPLDFMDDMYPDFDLGPIEWMFKE